MVFCCTHYLINSCWRDIHFVVVVVVVVCLFLLFFDFVRLIFMMQKDDELLYYVVLCEYSQTVTVLVVSRYYYIAFSRVLFRQTKSMLHKLCLCKLFNALYKLVKCVSRYLRETFDRILLNSLVMKDKIAVVFAVVFA